MEPWKTLGAQAFTALAKPFLGEAKSYPSRRLCPECGAGMRYIRTNGLLNKYARKCSGCDYTDAYEVKMVRQL